MKRLAKVVLALIFVAGLAGMGSALSARRSGGPAKGDYAVGGGRFGPGCFTGGVCFAKPRDFSVDAHADRKDKHVSGRLFYGNNEGALSVAVDVTCLRLSGNRAVVGGIDQFGNGATMFLIDNGPPGPGARDLASPLDVDTLDAPQWPAGFPYVCPSLDGNAAGYQEVHSGDVQVQDDVHANGGR